MQPDFRITANGAAFSEEVRRRITSIEVRDNAGYENDSLSIVLEGDTRPHIVLPAPRTLFELELGYQKKENMEQPYPMTFVGSFVSDEVEVEKTKFNGTEVTFLGHSVDSGASIKEPRSEEYENLSVGDIIRTAATRHGYETAIAEEFNSVIVRHLSQNTMSDISMIQSLAMKHGANVKVWDNTFYVARPGSTFKNMNDIIRENDCISYHWLSQGRGIHKAVKARWLDKDAGKLMSVIEATSTPEAVATCELIKTYPDEDTARAAARAQVSDLDKGRDTFTFKTIGNPTIMSETLIQTEGYGFYDEMPSLWSVVRVTHNWSKASGYTTEAYCELPGSVKKKSRKTAAGGTVAFGDEEEDYATGDDGSANLPDVNEPPDGSPNPLLP